MSVIAVPGGGATSPPYIPFAFVLGKHLELPIETYEAFITQGGSLRRVHLKFFLPPRPSYLLEGKIEERLPENILEVGIKAFKNLHLFVTCATHNNNRVFLRPTRPKTLDKAVAYLV